MVIYILKQEVGTLKEEWMLKSGDRYIGGVSDVVDVARSRKYPNIIICLWSNKNTYKSVIANGWKKNCNHVWIEKDNICKMCGAYVGQIGKEKDTTDLYEHIFWLVNSLYNYTNRVIIKSDFYIPTDYRQRSTGLPIQFNQVTSHHIYDKVIPMSSMNLNVFHKGFCFLTVYQKKDMETFIKTPSLYCSNLCVFDILLEPCLIVNPDDKELKNTFTKNFLLCNSEVVDIMRNKNLS